MSKANRNRTLSDLTFDGETICPACGVVICAFCQGTDPTCERIHKPDCAIHACFCFAPDPEHINALPEPLRRYVHDLGTRCDPAGDIQTIHALKDENAALRKLVEEFQRQIHQAKKH